jgi:D-threo-aldose 1-dehydrogenase
MFQKRRLGRCGIDVTTLGVGGGTLATGGGEVQTLAMLEAWWEAGLRYFDTAPLYGQSEVVLGRFLSTKARQSFVVSTKVGRLPAPAGTRRFDFSRQAVETSVANSLRSLATDYVDVLAVHDLTPAMLGNQFEQSRKLLLEETVDYLLDLKRQGIVRAIGLALYDCDTALTLLQTGAFDTVMIVSAYTLLCQDAANALLPYCVAHDIGVLLASVLHTGLLATGAVHGARYNYQDAGAAVLERVRRIEAICALHGVPLHAAALRFPLLHPGVAGIVVGHQSPAEVAASISALEAQIPHAFWQELLQQQLVANSSNIDLARMSD